MEDEFSKKKYAKYYDLSNKNKNYEIECDFLEQVFRKYSKFEIKEILDLGCGTGIHDKKLGLRGYKILGIDLLKEMIELANLNNPSDVEFRVGDMTNFDLDKKFDACISMFASMGYLTENKQLESFFKSVKRHLKPGGLFVLDCWNGLGVMNDLPSQREKIVGDVNFKIIRKSFPKLDSANHLCTVKFDIEIYENNILIDKYNELHKMRFFFPQELRKYLEDEGFELLEIYQPYELGTTISESDWNMVLIARLKSYS